MMGLNALLCLVKLSVGWVAGSFALLADGMNNFTDVGVSVALYLGMRVARRPPDTHHAYGHGKLEQELARLVAIVVLATGGGIIVSAIRDLAQPHEPPDLVVLPVAVGAILLKLYMYCYQNRVARRLSSSSLAADAVNHISDVAATSCVLVGALGTWIGGKAWAPADHVAAIVVGLLMVVAAAHTIREASDELLDRMPPQDVVDHIRSLAGSFPGVAGVDQIMGRKTGLHYQIDIHLEVAGQMPVTEAHRLGHQVKDWVMAELPAIRDIVVHIEPERQGGTG